MQVPKGPKHTLLPQVDRITHRNRSNETEAPSWAGEDCAPSQRIGRRSAGRLAGLAVIAVGLTLSGAAHGQQNAKSDDTVSSVLEIPISEDLQLPPDITLPRVYAPAPPLTPGSAQVAVGPDATARPAPHPNAIAPAAANDPYEKFGKYDVTRIGERGVGGGLNIYSLERERALGRELAQEVNQSTRFVSDQRVVNYINRLGQALVRHSDARVPFTIRVVDNDEINAFALPGGFLYINSGLILAASSEASLAGVMAHEIAHVAARHATRAYTRAQVLNLASIPLVFIGGPVTYALRQAMGVGAPLSIMKFSRDNEREADLLGIEYAYASGYDPTEFVHFFEKLRLNDKHKHRNLIAKAFATHPMTSDRVKRAQTEIETMLPPKEEYIVDTSEFEQVKARLARVEHREVDANGRELPTLRRRDAPVRPRTTSSDDEKPASPDDDRPRLHR